MAVRRLFSRGGKTSKTYYLPKKHQKRHNFAPGEGETVGGEQEPPLALPADSLAICQSATLYFRLSKVKKNIIIKFSTARM